VAYEFLQWVASGRRAHVGMRPLHLAQLSLGFERQQCDSELIIRRGSGQASRGHELRFANASNMPGRCIP